jgi:hypothetical protein
VDDKKLKQVIVENLNKINSLLEKKQNKENHDVLYQIKIYLEVLYSSKEENLIIEKESIKKILKKINIKLNEFNLI